MPHLSPMTWFFVSELMLLSTIIFASVLWWGFNSSLGIKVNFEGFKSFEMPWN